jgi:hypothetical protein
VRIQKDLRNNDDLKRVSIQSATFHDEVNRQMGEKLEQDIDMQIEQDFGGLKPERCPTKKHTMNLTSSEFYMKEEIFRNPLTSMPPKAQSPLDQFRFSSRKRKALSTMRPSTNIG